VLGPVSLLKPTLIILKFYPLFSQIEPVGLEFFLFGDKLHYKLRDLRISPNLLYMS